ncbi:DUF6290 family protein [Microbacterium sp.]|uniref:DUF6290 family protein n=1 Tax=Microbacterium sp. TaxID=51671 RepID=UPI002735E831|nr:DUF6290 family protein [Microbacterium sp.]MDP3951059.1 DUF6290 family protein [Microbacterium sp.]
MDVNREQIMRQAVADAEATQEAAPGTGARRLNRGTVLSVRLNDDEAAALQKAANEASVPVSTLARALILDHLRNATPTSSITGNDWTAQLAAVVRKAVHDELAAQHESERNIA